MKEKTSIAETKELEELKLTKLISTEETKKITGLDDTGIRKIRKLYRTKGRIQNRALFTLKQVLEISEIVAYQRSHPHSSYLIAYDAVVTSNALHKLLTQAPDDFTSGAEVAMGSEGLEHLFHLFNELTDFLKKYDEDSAQLIITLQQFILAKIAMQASKGTI